MDYKIKGETLTAIADTIRSKTGSKNTITPEKMANGVEDTYEMGKTNRDYNWWQKYQTSASAPTIPRNNYLYAFAGEGWNDETYNPVKTINATTHCGDVFAYSKITDTKVPVSIDSSVTTNKTACFRNATEMVTIRKFIINEKQSMIQQFTNCKKLENLTIEGTIGREFNAQWCPLSRASIENVVSCLSTTTTGLTCTFKTSAVNNAFETSEGAADGSTSEAWNTLMATKSNWTFSLIE